MVPSFAFRGPKGAGKRTQLLRYLEGRAAALGVPFHVKESTWYLTKPSNGSANPDDEDDESSSGSKSIPYEESAFHLGFDVVRMSMSDKMFLQSILSRWTGQQDLTLLPREHQKDSQEAMASLSMRYLVLYHAHYLTDESTLQLQEALEQFPTFAILLTTELPVCARLRDACLEIPVPSGQVGGDRLLANYTAANHLPATDVWTIAVQQVLETWSTSWSPGRVQEVRNWVYTCLQRNLRWTDMIRYWMDAAYACAWMTSEQRKKFMGVLWRAESGAGWVLISSYRIPLLWESVHLQIARSLYEMRQAHSGSALRQSRSAHTTS